VNNVDVTVIDFVAGPRATWHNHSRFSPYIQALFGGAYSTASAPISAMVVGPSDIVPPGVPISARVLASHTGFAMLAGGGLDIRVSRHVAFRPIEADYYLTRLSGILTGTSTQNLHNFRYAAGVNFLFGGAK
jgi:hypothetical protein